MLIKMIFCFSVPLDLSKSTLKIDDDNVTDSNINATNGGKIDGSLSGHSDQAKTGTGEGLDPFPSEVPAKNNNTTASEYDDESKMKGVSNDNVVAGEAIANGKSSSKVDGMFCAVVLHKMDGKLRKKTMKSSRKIHAIHFSKIIERIHFFNFRWPFI